jgi:hypothetical protein
LKVSDRSVLYVLRPLPDQCVLAFLVILSAGQGKTLIAVFRRKAKKQLKFHSYYADKKMKPFPVFYGQISDDVHDGLFVQDQRSTARQAGTVVLDRRGGA